jgi:phospholipid/cholesterol/gamma-HCH transport system substrate-binding protein
METRSNQVLVGSVVLILLVMMALFLVWLARGFGTEEKEYDIFFKQSVSGLAKGSSVAFAGVPSGQVKDIALWKENPQFVRVRISVKDDTPILQGTTASIQGVGFTGVSEIQLDGAIKDAPPSTFPELNPQSACPYGVPVIPTRRGGLGALLSSAPQLLEKLNNLVSRLVELLNDKNQKSISGILANTDKVTRALADHSQDIAQTLVQTRITLQKAGEAADKLGALSDSANGLLKNNVGPSVRNLNKTIVAAQHSLETLDAAVGDVRPGLQTFSKETLPEASQLVHDLRQMSQALTSVAEKIDQNGGGSVLSSPPLPDYKRKK